MWAVSRFGTKLNSVDTKLNLNSLRGIVFDLEHCVATTFISFRVAITFVFVILIYDMNLSYMIQSLLSSFSSHIHLYYSCPNIISYINTKHHIYQNLLLFAVTTWKICRKYKNHGAPLWWKGLCDWPRL